jgi:hypothetical protein
MSCQKYDFQKESIQKIQSALSKEAGKEDIRKALIELIEEIQNQSSCNNHNNIFCVTCVCKSIDLSYAGERNKDLKKEK